MASVCGWTNTIDEFFNRGDVKNVTLENSEKEEEIPKLCLETKDGNKTTQCSLLELIEFLPQEVMNDGKITLLNENGDHVTLTEADSKKFIKWKRSVGPVRAAAEGK